MANRWVNRPEGSNWGEFGPDDQIGRVNLLTPERVVRAVKGSQNRQAVLPFAPTGLPRRTVA